MTFFLAALGRSGTNWIVSVLSRAENTTVMHEAADPRSMGPAADRDYPWSPFPVERFVGHPGHYGECHGYLRHHLTAGYAGPERVIPRRGWLRRDPRDVIASWIDNGDVPPAIHPVIMDRVLRAHVRLRDWSASDPGAAVFDMERLTRSTGALQEFVDWLGLSLVVTDEMREPKNRTRFDRRRFHWTPETDEIYQRLATSHGF